MNSTVSKTILKIRSVIFFGFAFLMLGLSGCEKPGLMEQTATPSVQAFLNDEPDCVEGERREFGMQATTEEHVLLPGMDLHISYFAMPGYMPSTECLCKVEYVVLEFDYLPQANDITVLDEQGDTLAFSGPFSNVTSPGAYIHVYANDHQPNIMIGFDPSVQPSPSLELAGGYCLIDNVSAPDSTLLLTTPYLEFNPENETRRTYIPAASAVAIP